jgi:hypothetical protein
MQLKLKSVFSLLFVLGLVFIAGLAFTACDSAGSPSGTDTHFKVVDANNQFVGFLIDTDSYSFTVWRPQLNDSGYYPTGIFTVNVDGTLPAGWSSVILYFREAGGKGEPYSTSLSSKYLLFQSPYNTDTDKVDEDEPVWYTWAEMDSDGLPGDTPVNITKGSTYSLYGGGLSDFDYTGLGFSYEASKLKIITQKDILGGLDIKGPVKIGG